MLVGERPKESVLLLAFRAREILCGSKPQADLNHYSRYLFGYGFGQSTPARSQFEARLKLLVFQGVQHVHPIGRGAKGRFTPAVAWPHLASNVDTIRSLKSPQVSNG